jgi:hypothetical protein
VGKVPDESLGLSRLGYPDKVGESDYCGLVGERHRKKREYEATSKTVGYMCLAAVAKACAAPVGESEKQRNRKPGGIMQ